jgi:Carbohydrate family 9 binding domain-like
MLRSLACVIGVASAFASSSWVQPMSTLQLSRPEIRVRATEDFPVTGRGDQAAWNAVEWIPMNARNDVKDAYASRFKVLYSSTGLYVLMDAADKVLTATFQQDFENLWTEDVFEVFLWTDERDPVYFEYEISPLGFELPILIPNMEGTFLGWRPWHYDGDRKIRKAAVTFGGPQQSGAKIDGWRAEIFIPYALLKPLRNVPPAKGARWRANFYRVDHDNGKSVQWDWSRVGSNFHEFRGFGTLIFE